MSHLDFTLALHRAIATDPAEQVCWSPFSVASALGLLAEGARGTSRDELVDLLGDLARLETDLSAAGTLAQPHHGEDEPVIAVSNTLWADASITIDTDYVAELARRANGTVRNAPFRAEPEKARQDINADVADTTRQLITELLPPGSIVHDTVSALVNALYLKCAWRAKFDDGATTARAFHGVNGTVEVPTMSMTEAATARHAHTDGWQCLSLPAAGGVEAVVLLPDGDLAAAEAELTAESLGALLTPGDRGQFLVHMPRLEVRTQAELTKALVGLGVRAVFGNEADLGGISPDALALQAVLHESVLKVDENGLEGAAATALMMRMTALPPTPREFTVDRPFLLVVRHAESGVVYFLARVTDPS